MAPLTGRFLNFSVTSPRERGCTLCDSDVQLSPPTAKSPSVTVARARGRAEKPREQEENRDALSANQAESARSRRLRLARNSHSYLGSTNTRSDILECRVNAKSRGEEEPEPQSRKATDWASRCGRSECSARASREPCLFFSLLRFYRCSSLADEQLFFFKGSGTNDYTRRCPRRINIFKFCCQSERYTLGICGRSFQEFKSQFVNRRQLSVSFNSGHTAAKTLKGHLLFTYSFNFRRVSKCISLNFWRVCSYKVKPTASRADYVNAVTKRNASVLVAPITMHNYNETTYQARELESDRYTSNAFKFAGVREHV